MKCAPKVMAQASGGADIKTQSWGAALGHINLTGRRGMTYRSGITQEGRALLFWNAAHSTLICQSCSELPLPLRTTGPCNQDQALLVLHGPCR